MLDSYKASYADWLVLSAGIAIIQASDEKSCPRCSFVLTCSIRSPGGRNYRVHIILCKNQEHFVVLCILGGQQRENMTYLCLVQAEKLWIDRQTVRHDRDLIFSAKCKLAK